MQGARGREGVKGGEREGGRIGMRGREGGKGRESKSERGKRMRGWWRGARDQGRDRGREGVREGRMNM